MKIKCWSCGKILDGDCSDTLKRFYCPECKEEHNQYIEQKRQEYVKIKKELMFENAMTSLEKQEFDFYMNRDVIEMVHEKIMKEPDKFDSAPEVIAAIILVQHGIKTKMQFKVDRYQVDFCLPELHIILEIDGDRHKLHVGKDSVRDEVIKNILGDGWEIIRVPASLLNQDASQLVYAIHKILETRKRGRVDWREVDKNFYKVGR